MILAYLALALYHKLPIQNVSLYHRPAISKPEGNASRYNQIILHTRTPRFANRLTQTQDSPHATTCSQITTYSATDSRGNSRLQRCPSPPLLQLLFSYYLRSLVNFECSLHRL